MTHQELLTHVDHTQLKAFATWEDIQTLCEQAIANHTASVCVPPCYVKRIHEKYGDQLTICTVIGFPNGYSTTASKCFEAADAVRSGADEIDMVINIGLLKARKYKAVKNEIESETEQKVSAVNIHVQGVHLPGEEEE